MESEDFLNLSHACDSDGRETNKNEGVETPSVTSTTVAKENVPEYNGQFGVNNQSKAVKPRVSFLREFDPLYSSPIRERPLIDNIIDDEDSREVTSKDTDAKLIPVPNYCTQNLLNISEYVPEIIHPLDVSETEAFDTPLTSPQKGAGDTTQENSAEDHVNSYQQSSDRTYEHNNSILVSSNEATVKLHPPSHNSSLDTGSDPYSKSESSKEEIVRLNAESCNADHPILPTTPLEEQSLNTESHEFFEAQSTLTDAVVLEKISSDVEGLLEENLCITEHRTLARCESEIKFNIVTEVEPNNSGLECSEFAEKSIPASALSFNEVQSEIYNISSNQSLSSGIESLPEENLCVTGQCTKLPTRCDSEIKFNSVTDVETNDSRLECSEFAENSISASASSSSEVQSEIRNISINPSLSTGIESLPEENLCVTEQSTRLLSGCDSEIEFVSVSDLEPTNSRLESSDSSQKSISTSAVQCSAEENSCFKNETLSTGPECLPLIEENSLRSEKVILPPECNTKLIEISSSTSDVLHPNVEEVEIHSDSTSPLEKSPVDVLPIQGPVEKSINSLVCQSKTLVPKMTDFSEDAAKQQQEISELRLQLNALQQARATLELEVRQKEEIIIKSQAEALKTEQKYKQEIKMLKEKVKENSTLIEKDGMKHLQEQLKEAQLKEAKSTADLQSRMKLEEQHAKVMEEYDRTLQHRVDEFEKLREKFEINKTHLANLELAFSDVHSKYEKSKESLQASLLNEEALIIKLDLAQATNNQHEERYESLRQHARNQIDKSNKELLVQRERYESEVLKLKAIIKRLEIKCSSLEISIQQKIEECEQLAALCDEVTGKKI